MGGITGGDAYKLEAVSAASFIAASTAIRTQKLDHVGESSLTHFMK